MTPTFTPPRLAAEVGQLLGRLGVPDAAWREGSLAVRSPINGEAIARVVETRPAEMARTVADAHAAWLAWRTVPAPRRGELVRLLGEELRAHKAELGRLVSIEAGKIASEGLGEVQEMIDICDFAVGLSRQLYGLTIATERPDHRMMETWHPLGVVGIISAFNFPVAVWAWNAALALVCGDAWSGSRRRRRRSPRWPCRRCSSAPGPASVSRRRPACRCWCRARAPSARRWSTTRAWRWSRPPAPPRWAAPWARGWRRGFARAMLELGGNNAAIVAPSADLDLALRGIAFAAMGTAGQRCTTLRRLIVHEEHPRPRCCRA